MASADVLIVGGGLAGLVALRALQDGEMQGPLIVNFFFFFFWGGGGSLF